jgi:hypothetical protein
MHNLAAQQPETVSRMAAKWEAWAKKVGALDWKTVQQTRATG